MSKITLASGQITQADSLTIELVRPPDAPAVVLVHWPPQATVADVTRFTATASAAMHILATAVTQLAAIRDPAAVT